MPDVKERLRDLRNRMSRASQLDATLFEEVEHDRGATPQALAVVLIVSAAIGVGSIDIGTNFAVGALIGGAALALAGWVVWAGITYALATTVLRGRRNEAGFGAVVRSLAFSQSVGVFRFFGFVSLVGDLLIMTVFLWQFLAMVEAARELFDYESSKRVFGVVLIGAVPNFYLTFTLVNQLFRVVSE